MSAASADPASEGIGPSGQDALAAEWSVRYANYLKTCTARAARTVELNEQLLKRVARGELTPVALQSQLTGFLTGNATGYANEVAETSMRFFTGLMRAGTAYSYELVDSILPGEVAPPDEPVPEFDPDRWDDWLQQLTDFATAENSAATAMLRTVMDKVASGAIAPATIQDASQRYHAAQLPGSIAQLVSLFFDLLSQLDQTHSDYGDRYLQAVLDLRADRERSAAVLELVGPLGGSASARFAVSNNADQASSVHSVMTDVRRADGVGPVFEPDVTVSPDRFTLGPGAEEILTLTIRLPATSFEAGPDYLGTLHVLSPGSTLVELPLRIRASAVAEQAGSQVAETNLE